MPTPTITPVPKTTIEFHSHNTLRFHSDLREEEIKSVGIHLMILAGLVLLVSYGLYLQRAAERSGQPLSKYYYRGRLCMRIALVCLSVSGLLAMLRVYLLMK
jgi:hypothetical protein